MAAPEGLCAALLEAAERGDVTALGAALDAGAPLDAGVPTGGGRPVHMAALGGHAAALALLLARGASVDDCCEDSRMYLIHDRWTSFDGQPLHLVCLCAQGSADAVRVLFDAGADVGAATHAGWTPLHCAAAVGNLEVARLLLERGAGISSPGGERAWSPLHIAAGDGHGGLMSLLLQHGAEVDATDVCGATPLLCAAEWCTFDHGTDGVSAARELLDAGADVNARSDDGRTALLIAATLGEDADAWDGLTVAAINMVKLLLERGADVNAADAAGDTAIHHAARA